MPSSGGHTVTLFNRGRTNPHLFPGVEKLVGDRDGDLDALRGREWDAVLDNSGFEPLIVRDSAQLLSGSVGQYLFVSTQSVYAERSIIDQDESGAVGRPGIPEDQWEGYGPLKALCEREVQRALPGGSTIVRPPVIVGPGDASDRFTYWVDRVHRGGEVLAPGAPADPTQFIDVRDLTQWMVRCLENGVTGVYNATGPRAPLEHRRDAVRDSSRHHLRCPIHMGGRRLPGCPRSTALLAHAFVATPRWAHGRLPSE